MTQHYDNQLCVSIRAHTYIIQLTPPGAFQWPITSSSLATYYPLNIYIYSFFTINPKPPCQHFLWEATGAPRENPRLSAKC